MLVTSGQITSKQGGKFLTMLLPHPNIMIVKMAIYTIILFSIDCEQSLRMVMRGRKSSEASESQGEAGRRRGKEGGTARSVCFPVHLQIERRNVTSFYHCSKISGLQQ